MAIWFEGCNDIECTIQQVIKAIESLGDFTVGVVSLMPGLTSVELVEAGNNFVTIKTNEGLMKRERYSIRTESESVTVEFDEVYEAGSKMTAKTHFLDEFTATDTGVRHHTVLSDVEASGLMGFFYRNFGKSNIGNAFLKAFKTYLEQGDG